MAEPSKISDKSVDRIATLFAGYSKASGTHGMPERDPNGLKWAIKKTAKTLTVGPTIEMWEKHLSGERPLGVVPIMDDSRCVWGSIDVDDYSMDLLELIARVESMKLPLVPCRSKSGGLHLFCFASEPVRAEVMQAALRCMAAKLGHGDAEIFPKQTEIAEGASGNWIVMPYYGDTFGGKLKHQFGLKKTGAEMTLEEFVAAAERARVTAAQLEEIKPASPERGHNRRRPMADSRPAAAGDPAAAFGDGPPCLQALASTGVDNCRNNVLLMMGIYCKRVATEDVSLNGRIKEHLRRYLMDGPSFSSSRLELDYGRAYEDVQNKRVYFKLSGLMTYLERYKVRVAEQQVAEILRDYVGAGFVDSLRLTKDDVLESIKSGSKTKVVSRVRNVWFVPSDMFEQIPEIPPTPLREVI